MTTTNHQFNSEDIAKLYPGPILVLSGPGTGKTHILALRIKDLIESKKVNPDEITVITFTNEAARNMKERLSDPEKPDVNLPYDKHPALICTMHSLGQRIIAENISKVGFQENFKVLTSASIKHTLLGDSSQLLGFDRIKFEDTMKCRQKGHCVYSEHSYKCKICLQYKQLLTTCNAIDFDDQIMLACKLLKDNKDILDYYKAKTKYLLVDEYQDINYAQFEFIKLLSDNQEDGLFVVGDDDQSIYGFRGGTPEFIRNFEKHFKNAKVQSLSLCRRCPPNVLKGAMAVIEKFNSTRLKKPNPVFLSQAATKIIFYDVPSQIKEAQMIASIAKKSLPSKVLILIPHQGFSEPIKKTLRRWRINYDCRVNIEVRNQCVRYS